MISCCLVKVILINIWIRCWFVVIRELDDDEKLDEFCMVLCVDVFYSMVGELFEE